MKQETINEIQQKYINRTSKMKLSKLYKVTLRQIYDVTAGLKMNPRTTNDYDIAKSSKEDIILMYLNGYKKVEIEAKTGVSPYFVTMFINELERATAPKRNVIENIEAIRRQESKLIKMATELANGKGSNKDYRILLSVHSSAEPFHGGVFEV